MFCVEELDTVTVVVVVEDDEVDKTFVVLCEFSGSFPLDSAL